MSGIADFLASKLKDLTPEKWDNFIRFLDARFSPLEEKAGIEQRVSDAIVARGLQVIEDGLGPFIVQAQASAENLAAMADLGAVFFATSSTTLEINTNEKVLTIPENRRAQFAPTAYVMVSTGTSFDNGFVGRRVAYDRPSGTLTLAVEQTMGGGTFSSWSISPIATTADLEAMRDQVSADRAAAQTARTGAETARGQAEGYKNDAASARTGAVSALADMRAVLAPPVADPGASNVGRLWYDGAVVRVYDGTGWAPAVAASLGGLRFEEGTFGPTPTGVITVGGGFSSAMVFVDGVKLSSDAYTLESPTITIDSPVEGQDWFVWAYQERDATDYYTKQEVNDRVAPKAPLASPGFTGTPTAPTPAASDDSTRVATTSFVQSLIELLAMVVDTKAPSVSPALTGTPTAPTPAAGDSTGRIPNTSWVQARVAAVSTALSNLSTTVSSLSSTVSSLAATVAGKLSTAGGTLSGQLTSIASIAFEAQSTTPRVSFHIPGVIRKYWQVTSTGMHLLDQNGTGHVTLNFSGQIWSQAYGWFHDRFFSSAADIAGVTGAAGGVGAYAFCTRNGGTVAHGQTVGGSTLVPAIGGTWRCMGRPVSNTVAGLFVRIS